MLLLLKKHLLASTRKKKTKLRCSFILTEHFNGMNTTVTLTVILCLTSVLSSIISVDIDEGQDATINAHTIVLFDPINIWLWVARCHASHIKRLTLIN